MTEARPRPDPYALVFGAEGIDDRLFPPIAAEADARGAPLHDPDRFLFLTSVGHLLQAIAGPADQPAGGEEPGEGKGEAMRQHGRLLYHAFLFWRAGKPVEELDARQLRPLLDGDREAARRDWALSAPAPAGYLRLPRNLVWAAAGPGLRPEPADGFFWALHTASPGQDGPDGGAAGGEPAGASGQLLHLLMVLGVRWDRPGFSIVTASGLTGGEPHWADLDARPGGVDFHTTLPGGELDRLYSVETTAELLKLASLCLRELERRG
jgi:hypothetical protein